MDIIMKLYEPIHSEARETPGCFRLIVILESRCNNPVFSRIGFAC